jgi:hypothetical protein
VIKTNTNFQLIFSNVLIAHTNASMIKPKYISNNCSSFLIAQGASMVKQTKKVFHPKCSLKMTNTWKYIKNLCK